MDSQNEAYEFYTQNIEKFDEIGKILRLNDENLHGYFYTLIDDLKKIIQKGWKK